MTSADAKGIENARRRKNFIVCNPVFLSCFFRIFRIPRESNKLIVQ
jgi:hypothetical protein